jgi:hypothetical protein
MLPNRIIGFSQLRTYAEKTDQYRRQYDGDRNCGPRRNEAHDFSLLTIQMIAPIKDKRNSPMKQVIERSDFR